MDRTSQIQQFLTGCDWPNADRVFLAGDASPRRYYRLTMGRHRAVLMDAPIAQAGDMSGFVQIARYLRKIGLYAPDIYEFDRGLGLILLEDLGDNLFFDAVSEPDQERPAYHAAIDVLAVLKNPLGISLPNYGPKEMTQAVVDTLPWYDPDIDIRAELFAALNDLDWSVPQVVLRDYHAQNLIWYPEKTGLYRVGLLDFQDAAIGHPLYDAVSLIKDARRNVSHETKQELMVRLQTEYQGHDGFERAFYTLSAQRNLRILGTFARLSKRDGKHHYLSLIPRVWQNLQDDLAHVPNLKTALRALNLEAQK